MSGFGTIASPVNFRLTKAPPVVKSLADAQRAINDLHQTAQITAQTINDNAGVGTHDPATWEQLNGQPSTIDTGNTGKFYVRALEDIFNGALIHLTNDGSGLIVAAQLAYAIDNTRPAFGFCSTPSPVLLSGTVGQITLRTGVLTTSGLVVGNHYFLSATVPGTLTNAPPVAAGNIEQFAGIALTPTAFFVNLAGWVQH